MGSFDFEALTKFLQSIFAALKNLAVALHLIEADADTENEGESAAE